jgi:hypothetical protein
LLPATELAICKWPDTVKLTALGSVKLAVTRLAWMLADVLALNPRERSRILANCRWGGYC